MANTQSIYHMRNNLKRVVTIFNQTRHPRCLYRTSDFHYEYIRSRKCINQLAARAAILDFRSTYKVTTLGRDPVRTIFVNFE